jgi:hypothetical protein
VHQWIDEARGRTVVLLGAGASQPAVPMTRELTQLVVDYLTAEYRGGNAVHQLWRAILPVIQGLVNEKHDIEYLFQAVETLGYRDSDPTRHWIRGFSRYGPYKRSRPGREDFARDAERLAHAIETAAYGIIENRSTGASTVHFEPLLNAPIVGIATLNYDTLVEDAARRCGVALSTGADEWDSGPRWRFPNDRRPLLKLHGSVNWRRSRILDPSWGLPRVGIYEVGSGARAAPNGRVDANLVFGGGNKLRPEGPWPALYSAFEDLLFGADVLVVVGYSFRDAHVDAAIRRWASAARNRRIIDIDPCPRERPSQYSSIGDLRHALDPDYVSAEGTEGLLRGTDVRRFELVQERTVEGLPHVFGT